ncbi:NVEALA domain-containing protein [Parabacteroides chinchillae]
MRKKIFGVAIIAAIAVTTGWNTAEAFKQVKIIDLILEDVEALAQSESGDNKGTLCFKGEYTGCSGSDGFCKGRKC